MPTSDQFAERAESDAFEYQMQIIVVHTQRIGYLVRMLFNRINLFRQEKGLSRKELAELVSVRSLLGWPH